jgi:hypothetical protein
MVQHTINIVYVLVGSTKVAVRGITHDDSTTPAHRALIVELDVIEDDLSAVWSDEELRLLVVAKLAANDADVVFAVPRVA